MGSSVNEAIKELAEEAEKGNFCLWLRRKDKCWGEKHLTQMPAAEGGRETSLSLLRYHEKFLPLRR